MWITVEDAKTGITLELIEIPRFDIHEIARRARIRYTDRIEYEGDDAARLFLPCGRIIDVYA